MPADAAVGRARVPLVRAPVVGVSVTDVALVVVEGTAVGTLVCGQHELTSFPRRLVMVVGTPKEPNLLLSQHKDGRLYVGTQIYRHAGRGSGDISKYATRTLPSRERVGMMKTIDNEAIATHSTLEPS